MEIGIIGEGERDEGGKEDVGKEGGREAGQGRAELWAAMRGRSATCYFELVEVAVWVPSVPGPSSSSSSSGSSTTGAGAVLVCVCV